MIRRLSVNDYEGYLSLISQFRETTFSKEAFESLVTSLPPMHEIWVYEENDTLVGTITILFEHKFIFNMCTFAHIEDVCVAETHRKRGIGSELLQFAIHRADERGCRKLTLVCADALVPFYERNGLEKRGNQMSKLIG